MSGPPPAEAEMPDPAEAVRAAVAALRENPGHPAYPESRQEAIEVLRVETRVFLRRGERVYVYLVGADGGARLDASGEKDGGLFMVRPPRLDV